MPSAFLDNMKFYLAPLEGITTYIYRNAVAGFFGEGISKYFTPFFGPDTKRSLKSREMIDAHPDNNFPGIKLIPQILTTDVGDYFEFENKLKEYFFGDNKLLAYVLLPDRVHLVTYEPPTSSSPTKPLCTSYARYYNRRHASTGRLFYDRFKSVPLETAFDITDTVKFLRQLSGGNLKDEICDKQKLFDVCGTLDFSGYATAMHLEDYQKMSVGELVACIAAAIAEELGKDVSAIRIHSIKKV